MDGRLAERFRCAACIAVKHGSIWYRLPVGRWNDSRVSHWRRHPYLQTSKSSFKMTTWNHPPSIKKFLVIIDGVFILKIEILICWMYQVLFFWWSDDRKRFNDIYKVWNRKTKKCLTRVNFIDVRKYELYLSSTPTRSPTYLSPFIACVHYLRQFWEKWFLTAI